ncbi:MAG: RNA polymerase sigma factor [Candidatus Magasanikbacteria bacterium]|nr:RNA polymerase sigma factor [Candidatus Magasanikbacteria bacterium]
MNKKDFLKFYDRHFDKIYRFVFFRVGGRKEVAEDLTSEIFLKALRHFEDYDPALSGGAWIFTIARNHLYNYLRDSGRRFQVSVEEITDDWRLEFSLQETGGGPTTEGLENLFKKDAEREVASLLAKLSSEKRQIVTLKHLLGYSFKEIGEILGMKEGTVKVAAHRALKELRQVSKI